jgi:hypothetical protein
MSDLSVQGGPISALGLGIDAMPLAIGKCKDMCRPSWRERACASDAYTKLFDTPTASLRGTRQTPETLMAVKLTKTKFPSDTHYYGVGGGAESVFCDHDVERTVWEGENSCAMSTLVWLASAIP